MTSHDETAKVTCPCCQALLMIDRQTLGIVHAKEQRSKAGGMSFEQSLQEYKAREKQKRARFQQAMEEEKQRKALLGKKFQELQKEAEAKPDASPPLRPFDLE